MKQPAGQPASRPARLQNGQLELAVALSAFGSPTRALGGGTIGGMPTGSLRGQGGLARGRERARASIGGLARKFEAFHNVKNQCGFLSSLVLALCSKLTDPLLEYCRVYFRRLETYATPSSGNSLKRARAADATPLHTVHTMCSLARACLP